MEYQPYLNKIDIFNELGIKVTWRTLLVGFMGPGKFLGQVSTQEIIDYACVLLESENVDDNVLELVSCSREDKEEIMTILNRLAEIENTQLTVEVEKWQVVLLSLCLKKINPNPLYGMIELTEFWEKFDYPPNCPHSVQGRKNDLNASEYYKEDYFKKTISRHHEWIRHQIEGFKE